MITYKNIKTPLKRSIFKLLQHKGFTLTTHQTSAADKIDFPVCTIDANSNLAIKYIQFVAKLGSGCTLKLIQ
jgi:hypothetical protein